MNGQDGNHIVQVEFKGERTDYFLNAKGFSIDNGDYVVVQVERGRDMGKIVRTGPELERITHVRPVTQEVLRKATDADMAAFEENKVKEKEARRVCEEKIAARGLKMKLVKDLAAIYKTRIELRQIGVRDEAKRLGGIGSCGRKYCCTTFLQEFEPVTLKMARDQSLSVSPTKISGACGRLMCCLAYERDYYMQVARRLPKVGTRVETNYGEATVTGLDIFAQAINVKDDEGNEMRLTLDQIKKPGIAKRLMKRQKRESREEEGDEA
jgi:cell fate regulator YaaT (PSP1 superfamily)